MAFAYPNPDLLARHYRLANRWALLRAQPGESLFQLLALLAFLGFALWICDPIWTRALDRDAPWAAWLPATGLGAALAIGLILQAQRTHRSLVETRQSDWLAAMPVAAADRAAARQRELLDSHLTSVALMSAILLWACFRAAAPSPQLCTLLALGIAIGAAAGLWQRDLTTTTRAARSGTSTRASTVVIPEAVRGLALLGAALEPAVARLPRTAPWVAGSFLLFPQSTPLLAVPALVLLFTALSSLLDRVAEWRQRYVADQRWLAAQPLAPRRLFLAYQPVLARRLLIWSLVFGTCVYALGAPPLFAAALTVVLAGIAGDAVLCAFATRRNPSRYVLLLALHGVIALTATQVLPPALPLVFLACALSAWRQGHA